MSDPLGFVGTAELGIACGIALCGAYTATLLFKALGPDDCEVKPIQLELPRSRERAEQLVEDWKKRGALEAMRRFTYVDFLFLVAYALALAAAGSLAARAAKAGLHADASDMTKVGAFFTYAGLVAGGLDATENVLMLAMMRKRWDQPIPAATTLVSASKWVLVAIAALGSTGLLIASAIAELI